MKKIFLFLILGFFICYSSFSKSSKITITGRVMNFNDNPIDSALIQIKNNSFKTLYSTYSSKTGDYSITLDEGLYFAISCVRMRDYGTNNLEFWAWNVPVFENFTLNIHYDKLEIYGVNVFKIQGAFPGYSIYFRPMSLTRFKNKLTDISPTIENLELKVEINGQNLKINSLQKVSEFATDQQLFGFLIQTDSIALINKDFDIIKIKGKDKENGDIGEAIYFKINEKYK